MIQEVSSPSILPAATYTRDRTTAHSTRVDSSSATRIMEGGVNKGTVRHIDSDGNRVLVYFRDAAGSRTVRLFSGNSSISSNDIVGGCAEFSYVPANSQSNRCRQLHPDPDTNNGTNIAPSDISSIPFRFLDGLQVINNTVSLWYRDSTGKHAVSIGQGSSKMKRGDTVCWRKCICIRKRVK